MNLRNFGPKILVAVVIPVLTGVTISNSYKVTKVEESLSQMLTILEDEIYSPTRQSTDPDLKDYKSSTEELASLSLDQQEQIGQLVNVLSGLVGEVRKLKESNTKLASRIYTLEEDSRLFLREKSNARSRTGKASEFAEGNMFGNSQ